MYAAVKRVLREQERHQRLELELERRRLERLLKLQLQASSNLNRRHSSENILNGGSSVQTLPFSRETLEQLLKSVSSYTSPPVTSRPGDIRLLGNARHGLFRHSTIEQSTKLIVSEAPKSFTSATTGIGIEEFQLDAPPAWNEAIPQNPKVVKGQPETECGWCGRRWSSRTLLRSGVLTIILSGIALCCLVVFHKDVSLTPFILLVLIATLVVIFGLGLILLGINPSMFHPCIKTYQSKNSSNAVGDIDIDSMGMSATRSSEVEGGGGGGHNSKPIGIYMKK